MITVSLSYLSGDVDNHANGVRVAACALFQDVALKAGFTPVRTLGGPGGDVVTYAVACATPGEYGRLVGECYRRGLVVQQLRVDPPPPHHPPQAQAGP